jgi:hypothetical protein
MSQEDTTDKVTATQPVTPAQAPEKTTAELKQELTDLVFNAGNLQYAIKVTEAQLRANNEAIQRVKNKYDASVAKDEADAKKKSLAQEQGVSTQTADAPSTSSESETN